MEIHIALDRDGNIHISDDHKNMPKNPVRSYFMFFPPNGQQRDVILKFNANTKVWPDEDAEFLNTLCCDEEYQDLISDPDPFLADARNMR